jgi:glycosyltransferase involved in cell wall biosynthesis
VNPKDLLKHVNEICTNVKRELRIYRDIEQYHKEIIICDRLTNEQVMAIHKSCDCFVGPSHGEGWSIPAFDAMCFGKTPICSREGGPADFLEPDVGWLVDGVYSTCNHSDPAFPTLFTGREHWFVPSEDETKYAMRHYYNNRERIDRPLGLKTAQKFSYINIGNQIKEALLA